MNCECICDTPLPNLNLVFVDMNNQTFKVCLSKSRLSAKTNEPIEVYQKGSKEIIYVSNHVHNYVYNLAGI